jgi:hypothetical protein
MGRKGIRVAQKVGHNCKANQADSAALKVGNKDRSLGGYLTVRAVIFEECPDQNVQHFSHYLIPYPIVHPLFIARYSQ